VCAMCAHFNLEFIELSRGARKIAAEGKRAIQLTLVYHQLQSEKYVLAVPCKE
jgi:hypothetical protein